MPEVRTQIPAAELKPGQFFKIGDRWYRAHGAPIQCDGKDYPQIEAASPVTGDYGWMWLHAKTVTVNEGNTVPSTFQPGTLERKARAARDQARKLLARAAQLENLATDIRFAKSHA